MYDLAAPFATILSCPEAWTQRKLNGSLTEPTGAVITAETGGERDMIVMKFGGTSVQDASWIERAIEIAEGRLEEAPVLVSSAMGGTTDALVSIAELAAEGKSEAAFEEVLSLRRSHVDTCERLFSGNGRSEAIARVEELFDGMTSLVQGLTLIRECTPRTLDALLAFGELLATSIIARRAVERGIDTRLLDSRELIVTDENFNSATPDFEVTKEKIGAAVQPKPGTLYVAQGFIAATTSGVTTDRKSVV